MTFAIGRVVRLIKINCLIKIFWIRKKNSAVILLIGRFFKGSRTQVHLIDVVLLLILVVIMIVIVVSDNSYKYVAFSSRLVSLFLFSDISPPSPP